MSRRLEAVLDEASLEAWAEAAGRVAAGRGTLVALRGPLGAGKTTFVRAAFSGAGAARPARSPTYTLHHPHRLPEGGRAHHVDLYRIGSPRELDDLGWEDLLASDEAVFVEWAERAGGRLPEDRWEIALAFEGAGERRRIEARALGRAPDLPALPSAAGAESGTSVAAASGESTAGASGESAAGPSPESAAGARSAAPEGTC
ncbi:MAG TPA: tRNA (adenosine(37)-N6)-threonylcarbamoyltransferase complex ATPase subunit type 1 TsaE [Gemmatimonadota bacterium]|nr:tRNA (adenosine(37)-N6)-threonylcarbamoyltransferase complex ATPase subunit type 1 TsaE [Gemmatimonadota bacterium]